MHVGMRTWLYPFREQLHEHEFVRVRCPSLVAAASCWNEGQLVIILVWLGESTCPSQTGQVSVAGEEDEFAAGGDGLPERAHPGHRDQAGRRARTK